MRLLLPLLFAGGCVAQVDIDDDPDGDGLADVDEVRLGADPGNPDSDGDGYLDGAEAAAYANPADAADHPLEGGWAMGACRNDLEGEGNAVGQIAQNFGLMDQFGETVHLHDFCDKIVFVTFAAFW